MNGTALRLARVATLLAGLFAALPFTGQAPTSSTPEKSAESNAIQKVDTSDPSQRGPFGPIEVLTDTQGVNFNPYLKRLLQDVREHWFALIPESAGRKRGKVVVEFAILKDGSVAGLRVLETSGDIMLDRPACESISGSNPFPPLPSEFKGPYLGLRVSYYYNVSSDIDRVSPPEAGVQKKAPENLEDEGAKKKVAGALSDRLPAASAPSGSPTPLSEADVLYRAGNLIEATRRYAAVLQTDPKSAEAYAGLTRVYLKQRKLRDAQETISRGLEVADSPSTRAALGEVLFREGKIVEAETEWLNLVNAGHADARTYLGLARISAASTQYEQARAEIDEAHRLDSKDPDIESYWTRSAVPARTCQPATGVIPTEISLIRVNAEGSGEIRGYGLSVNVSGQPAKLLLDTGAHGIVIDRKIAQKAGLARISDTTVGGFGDHKKSPGYMADANSIKIGGIEFRDCTITVIDKSSVLGEDGLIGTDVFQDFLIDVDFPDMRLGLGHLPSDDGKYATAGGSAAIGGTYKGAAARFRPGDFSFSFVPVYRFGHMLLIPTEMGDSLDKRLFAIDTGSPRNLFSVNTAEQMSQVHENSRMEMRGLSGSVKKVYDTEKTAVHFGNVQQYADRDTALNLEGLSDEIGTEVSGVIGVLHLHATHMTIDYRDGFVGFDFLPQPMR